VADPELRIISRWETTDGSTTPHLQRPNMNRMTEFLASRDPAFRPNQIIAGPDGALYVADLGRERLEESVERGRIWRLQPEDHAVTKAPALSRLPSIELVKLLGNPNGWVRDTAARLLFERNEPEAYRTAAKELRWNWNPMCKAQALQVLAAGDSLNEAVLIRGLQDKDANVRATAAALCARIISDRWLAPTLLGQLSAACRDASPRVRLEAVLTLGGVNHSSVPVMLASALRPAPADPWIQSAVLTSTHTEGAAAVLGQLVGNANVYRDPSGWSFLRQLARQAGLESRLKLDELLALLEASGLRIDDQLLLAGDIGEGLFATGRSFVSGSSTNASRFFGRRALELAIGGNAAATRAEAIRFLGVSGFTMKEAGDWLLVMLSPGEPESVQLAAVDALAHFPDPRVTDTFVQRWPRLNANVQAAIITRLLEQFDRTHALMAALEARTIAPAALSDVQVNFLRNHRDQTIAARATQLYGARTELNLSRIADAVSQTGSSTRGRRIFEQRCLRCHSFDGVGGQLAPDLAKVGRKSREELLSDIFNPSTAVAPSYQTKVLQRTSNQLLVGLVQTVGADFVRVDQADGTQIFLPSNQVEDTFDQDWSLMPNSAASGLRASDLADLLSFLQSPAALAR
jgi:putative heme-binding domain-containing protein